MRLRKLIPTVPGPLCCLHQKQNSLLLKFGIFTSVSDYWFQKWTCREGAAPLSFTLQKHFTVSTVHMSLNHSCHEPQARAGRKDTGSWMGPCGHLGWRSGGSTAPWEHHKQIDKFNPRQDFRLDNNSRMVRGRHSWLSLRCAVLRCYCGGPGHPAAVKGTHTHGCAQCNSKPDWRVVILCTMPSKKGSQLHP